MRRLKSLLKWFYPGMRIKRWLLLTPFGVFFVIVGVGLLANVRVFDYLELVARPVAIQTGWNLAEPRVNIPVSLIAIAAGLVLIFVSFRQVIGSIASVISPTNKDRLADFIFQRRYLAQGHRIVVVGGGTGLSTMIRGLKAYTSNIVAIVTVADDVAYVDFDSGSIV